MTVGLGSTAIKMVYSLLSWLWRRASIVVKVHKLFTIVIINNRLCRAVAEQAPDFPEIVVVNDRIYRVVAVVEQTQKTLKTMDNNRRRG